MPTTAKRLGLDVGEIELESRLRRIEVALETKADTAALSEDASTSTQRVDAIPQVTGLRVSGSLPGAITVAWNQVRISDLRRYELDVAEDLAFATNAETKNIAGTEFTYTTNSDTGGGGNTTIFIRVRARSSSGNVGPYSTSLNTTTGQAKSGDIADDAVTNAKLDNSAIIQLALREYVTIRGFHMSNATDKEDLTVTRGVARGEGDDGTINLESNLTKQIDANFALGTDKGGFPSGLTLTDGTDYKVFAFSRVAGTGADIGMDTSATAANLISDAVTIDSTYANALYRQIGWITYKSSAIGIRPFYSPVRDPELVTYQTMPNGIAVSISTSSALLTLEVPPDVEAHYIFKWAVDDSSSQGLKRVWLKSPAMTDAACGSNNFTHEIRRESETDRTDMWEVKTEVNSSSQIRVRFDAVPGGSRTIHATGFRFIR